MERLPRRWVYMGTRNESGTCQGIHQRILWRESQGTSFVDSRTSLEGRRGTCYGCKEYKAIVWITNHSMWQHDILSRDPRLNSMLSIHNNTFHTILYCLATCIKVSSFRCSLVTECSWRFRFIPRSYPQLLNKDSSKTYFDGHFVTVWLERFKSIPSGYWQLLNKDSSRIWCSLVTECSKR
jgi:hypothetical protein